MIRSIPVSTDAEQGLPPVLEVDGLTKVYGPIGPRTLERTGPDAPGGGTNICPDTGSVVALNNVSLKLYPGQILAVIGESGSGKSTLLKTLYLDEPPTEGSALFRDPGLPGNTWDQAHDLFLYNPAQARRLRDRHIGIVRQNPKLELNFNISAGGNIAERVLAANAAELQGHPHYGDIRQRALDLLSETQVPTARIDERPGNFSGGMQQRVQIAKALAIQPPVLLLDEITTGLDLSVQARIIDLILDLHDRLQPAILLVTHDISVVRTLASQTIVMRYGQIVEQGLTDQVLEDPQHPYTQELVNAAL
ncbi:MAG: ATP-binding cassette domain-containing protein [Planctomycetota bacterium]